MTRLLVMGGGLIGRRHVERLLAHPHAVCAGLVEPDPSVAVDLPVPRYRDCADVSDPVDGVIIATPTPLHSRHAQEVGARGWPMLIEKPVADSLAATDALRDITAPILIGHHRRHHPRVKALRTFLDAGGIGTPVTASLIWAMRKPDSYFDGNWRSAGGSPVMINLVHDLDLLAHWFGPITRIAALRGPGLRGANRVESGAVALNCASGLSATISFADTAPSPWGFEAGTGENPNIGTTGQDMLWITGTKGSVAFPSLTPWYGTNWADPATPQPAIQTNDTAPLDAQLDHFLDVIAGRADPLCTLADGRAALAAALEIEGQLAQQEAA